MYRPTFRNARRSPPPSAWVGTPNKEALPNFALTMATVDLAAEPSRGAVSVWMAESLPTRHAGSPHMRRPPFLASMVGATCENLVVSVGTEAWYPRSFVLTDIVGSVSLWERDATVMSEAVAQHDVMVEREVIAAGGELVRSKGEGDSTFSVFAHPAQAVAAADAVQRAIASQAWPTAAPLRLRAGVHTGDAEPRDGDWYGPAVNRAARLRALADAGQTLVSGVTAGLVAEELPDGAGLLYRGRRLLRGIERPEEVWELVASDDPRLRAATSGRAGGLPVALTRFVGRTVDVQHLVGLAETERLVTLTGPGGAGKTRLALEVAADAERRGEQVWLAELAPLEGGDLVAQAVATAVGLETGPDPLDSLVGHAARLTGLLVLDNCEHVLGASRTLTERLLSAASGLRVLATSREPLGLMGEQVWPVGPLTVPDASVRDASELSGVESVELLLDRARAVRPGLAIDDEHAAPVVQICRALDGVPLAIELAAGRLRSLSLADLAARLDDQLAVLTRPQPVAAAEARHRTLRMTLNWSYELLTEPQRTLARRLSVFAGGFRLDAVEAVCGGDLDVLDGVDELVAKSVVTFDGVSARYRLLEPLRQYLAEHLDATGTADNVRRAHAEWVASLCERLGARLLAEQKACTARLREETANVDLALRCALDHCDHEIALRIVGSLGQYWFQNDQASGRRWCAATIEAAAGAPPRRRAKALVSGGMVGQNDQDWARSVAWLREALAIYRAERAIPGQAASLFWLGRALALWGDLDQIEVNSTEAALCFDQSLALSIQLGDTAGAAWCRVWLGALAFWDQDLDRAERLAEQALHDAGAVDAQHAAGEALCSLAFIARRRGDDGAAVMFLRDAVGRYRDLDDRRRLAEGLVDLAAQEVTVGRTDEALQALAESSRLDDQLGRLTGRSYRLAVAAAVHLARGQIGLAVAALGAYDTHAYTTEGTSERRGRHADYSGWFSQTVAATRARLEPGAVADASTAAQTKNLDQLIHELILQPAGDHT
jgi:predicted ATPase/class 3 adenylate cyclase